MLLLEFAPFGNVSRLNKISVHVKLAKLYFYVEISIMIIERRYMHTSYNEMYAWN